MANGQNVRDFMACCLDCSVLYLPSNVGCKHSFIFWFLSKVGVVSGVALDADPPTLLSHAKDEGPTFLGIEICVREHKQTLMVLELYVLLQVVEDLTCVELFYFCIWPNSGLDNALFLKHFQVELQLWVSILFVITDAVKGLLHSDSRHPAEENLEDWLHIIHQHFLERLLLSCKFSVLLLIPHLENDAFVYVPIANLPFELIKSLRLLLRIFLHPVTVGERLFSFKLRLHSIVNLFNLRSRDWRHWCRVHRYRLFGIKPCFMISLELINLVLIKRTNQFFEVCKTFWAGLSRDSLGSLALVIPNAFISISTFAW